MFFRDNETLKQAENDASNPKKPFSIRNYIKKRIKYLNEHGGDLLLIAHLRRWYNLLESHEYRTYVKRIKKTMKEYSK